MLINILENANTVISLIAGFLSIIMFFLAKKQKDECVKINNEIEQKIQIINKESSIKSKDKFDIKNIETFDNRKSIK